MHKEEVARRWQSLSLCTAGSIRGPMVLLGTVGSVGGAPGRKSESTRTGAGQDRQDGEHTGAGPEGKEPSGATGPVG